MVVVRLALGALLKAVVNLLKVSLRTRENRPRAVEEEARMIARAATRTGTIIRGRLLRGRGLLGICLEGMKVRLKRWCEHLDDQRKGKFGPIRRDKNLFDLKPCLSIPGPPSSSWSHLWWAFNHQVGKKAPLER